MAKRKNSSAASKRAPVVPQDKWGMGRHIAWWALLLMVFITPIAISNLTFLGVRVPLSYDQFDIIKVFCQRVLGMIALAAWATEILIKGGKIRRTPVELLILVFLAWVSVSAALSIHPATAIFGKYRRFEGLLSFINYAVIYFLVLQLADKPSRIKQMAQSLFFSGVVVGGYGLMQAFGKDILQWGTLPFELNRSFSTYGNPDLLGGFLMFGTFVSIGLALAETNLIWRGIYWAGFLMNSAVIVTAFTRSAWIGAVAGFFFIVMFAIRQRAPWRGEDWAFAGTAGAGVAYFIIRSLGSDNPVMNFTARVKSIFEFGQGSAKTRFEIWESAINAIKARPLFGFGADTFRLVFPRYKPVAYVKDAGYLSVADNVHNYPLQLAAGIGIPGMLMFYGICGWVAARSWNLVWTKDEKNRMLYAGIWTACAAYVVHLFFGLSVTGASFLLWMAMGLLMAPTATTFDIAPRKWSSYAQLAGTFGALAICALALFGVGYQFRMMAADRAYLMSRIGTQGSERTAYAQQAVQLNPWNDMYRAEVGLALTDEAIAALNSANTQGGQSAEALRSSFTRAETSLQDTINFVKWEYDNYVFLANLYNLGGQYIDPSYRQKAIDIAEQGTKVEPYGPAVRFQLARALQTIGREDDAVKELITTLNMDPAYGEVSSMLADIYIRRGEPTKALEALKKTYDWSPGTPGIADRIKSLEASLSAGGKP